MEVSSKHIFRVFLRQCVCVCVCVCVRAHTCARVSVCLTVHTYAYSYSTRERERVGGGGVGRNLHEFEITAEKWWVWDMVLGWGFQPPAIDLRHFWVSTVRYCLATSTTSQVWVKLTTSHIMRPDSRTPSHIMRPNSVRFRLCRFFSCMTCTWKLFYP